VSGPYHNTIEVTITSPGTLAKGDDAIQSTRPRTTHENQVVWQRHCLSQKMIESSKILQFSMYTLMGKYPCQSVINARTGPIITLDSRATEARYCSHDRSRDHCQRLRRHMRGKQHAKCTYEKLMVFSRTSTLCL
jgi:hypothetical protein